MKRELSWSKLDKERSGLRRFWVGLKECCKRKVTFISVREYYRALTLCTNWDVLMGIHLGYVGRGLWGDFFCDIVINFHFEIFNDPHFFHSFF